MRSKKDNGLASRSQHQSHSADSIRPNHFRFPHFLKPMGLQPTAAQIESSTMMPNTLVSSSSVQNNSSMSRPGLMNHGATHVTLSRIESSSFRPGDHQQPTTPSCAQADQLKTDLAAIWSSNALVRRLLIKWRSKIQTLGCSSSQAGPGGVPPTMSVASPSITSDAIMAELSAEMTKIAALASRKAVATKERSEFITDSTAEGSLTSGYSSYGPLSTAALLERRRHASGSQDHTDNCNAPEDDAWLGSSTLTSESQKDLQAAVAALLLCQVYGAKVGGDGTYYKLLSTIVNAAFCENQRVLPKDQCSYTFGGDVIQQERADSDSLNELSTQGLNARPVGGAKSVQLPDDTNAGKTFIVSRSYRELYSELAEKRNRFLRRPERVLERLGVTKSKLILRIVFLAWRAGFRRRSRKHFAAEERADFLFRKKRSSVLYLHFNEWRLYVQKYGKHKRVLQYQGSKDKLIQRLARRVEELEGEKRSMTNELENLRGTQAAVQKDLLDIRRLVLGNADAEKFQRLITAREERRKLGDLTVGPSLKDVARLSEVVQNIEEVSAPRPATPMELPHPPPADMARAVLRDFMAQLEAEEKIADTTTVSPTECGPSELQINKDISVIPVPTHLQLLDWTLLRCQQMGNEILLLKQHVEENEKERLAIEQKRQQRHSKSNTDQEPIVDDDLIGASKTSDDLLSADHIVSILTRRPRNFVADFADGLRLSFLLLSVGATNYQLPAMTVKLRDEQRRTILQQAYNEVMGYPPTFGSTDADADKEGYLQLSGSKLAKAIQSMHLRYQGTPAAPLNGRIGSLFFKIRPAELEAHHEGRSGSRAFSDKVIEAGASSSDEDSVHSIYERHFTEEELAKKWGGQGEDTPEKED